MSEPFEAESVEAAPAGPIVVGEDGASDRAEEGVASVDGLDVSAIEVVSGGEQERRPDSPLMQHFGLPVGIMDQHVHEVEVLQRRADLIGNCMRAQGYEGFVHIPEERLEPSVVLSLDSSSLPRGYGVADTVEAMLQASRDGSFQGPAPILEQPSEFSFNGMSSLSSDGEAEMFRHLSSCESAAQDEIPLSPSDGWSEQLRIELGEAVADIEQTLQSAAPWAEWSDCMAQEGYHATTREQLLDDLHVQAEGVSQGIANAFGAGQSQDENLDEQLDSLRTLEMLIYRADAVCATAVDLDRRLFETRRRLEQSAVDAHGDRWYLMLLESQEPS